MTLNGIDISVYQNPTPPLAGLSFVFARSSYGVAADTMYATHAADVRKAGLVLGAYHFWYDGHTAASQVAEMLSMAPNADLYALDFEGTNTDATGAKAFIAATKATGRKCGLYHSLSGFPAWGQDYNWVAAWGTVAPSIPWAFWQHQGSPLDLDYFNGDEAALQALVGGDVKIATKFERWLDADKVTRVTTLGAPYKADGTVDYSQRLLQLPTGSLQLVPVTRFPQAPSYNATTDAGLQAAIKAYALPTTPAPTPPSPTPTILKTGLYEVP